MVRVVVRSAAETREAIKKAVEAVKRSQKRPSPAEIQEAAGVVSVSVPRAIEADMPLVAGVPRAVERIKPPPEAIPTGFKAEIAGKRVEISIPREVREGRQQLPVFDVIDIETGKPIPRGMKFRPKFVPRPQAPAKPPRLGTELFVTEPAAIAEKKAMEIEFERGITKAPEALRAGLETGFERLRTVPGRKPSGAERLAELFVTGAVVFAPSIPATVFSVVTKPVETGQQLATEFIRDPLGTVAELAGGAVFFGAIGRGLKAVKTPKPTISADVGKAFPVKVAGKPAELIITKGIVKVGKKEFRAAGAAVTIETGALNQFIGVGRAAVARAKPKAKPEFIDVAIVGEELPTIIPKTRTGVFVGALRTAKVKDIFAGRFFAQKQAGLTKALTITAARRAKLGAGLTLIEEFKPPVRPSRIPPGQRLVPPVTKPAKAAQAALRKAFVEAPKIKRAVTIERVKAVVPRAAAVTGLAGLKQVAAGRARANLIVSQLTEQKPAAAVVQRIAQVDVTVQKRAVKTALRSQEKLQQQIISGVEFKQPQVRERITGLGQFEAQIQAQSQAQAQRQRQLLRQRPAQRQRLRPKIPVPFRAGVRAGFAFPIIPGLIDRRRPRDFDTTRFRFREIINPLGTPEQILGLKPLRRKRRTKKRRKR